MQSLDDLFYAFLQDIYFAEKELLKALPMFAARSTDDTLGLALRDHQDETAEHVARLEKVFKAIGKEPRGKTSDAMVAIIAQVQRVIDESDDEAVRDAGILAAAQSAEHYEIARYGTLVAWAEHLGDDEIVDLLCETLEEEKHADELLSSIAEGGVNANACERAQAAG